jgi:hypothetical protein
VSETSTRGIWDRNIGVVLVVVGSLFLLLKLKIHTLVLSLWPVGLIILGWQMYRKADAEDPRSRRRGRVSPPPPPAEDLDEDPEEEFEDEEFPADESK